jgi:hypothetical protein
VVECLHRIPASRRRRRKGKSRIWDSKIGSGVPRDSDPRMTALVRASSYYKRQTRPLVRGRAPHQQTRNHLTVMRIYSKAPDACSIPGQTGRLTVGRNISLTLTWIGVHCPTAIVKDRPILSSDIKTMTASVLLQKILVVGLKGLGAKTNWLAVNRQS